MGERLLLEAGRAVVKCARRSTLKNDVHRLKASGNSRIYCGLRFIAW